VLVLTHHPDHPHLPHQTSESGSGLACKKSFSTVFAGLPTLSAECRPTSALQTRFRATAKVSR
jgi:hypothetical protein